LIQSQTVSRDDESAVFFFNLAIGASMTIAIVLCSPLVAAFFAKDQIEPLLRVLAFVVLIGSFSVVPHVQLQKELQFKTQTKISVASTVLSGILGIACAFNGLGVWSLVAQALCQQTVKASLLWLLSPWRPLWSFRLAPLRRMMPFGLPILLIGVVENVFRNIHTVIIGRYFTVADVGVYRQAWSLQQIPSQSLSQTVANVAFPVLSKLQEDRKRLVSALRESIRYLALVNFPVMLGLVAIAEPLVDVLLGPKWHDSIPYLRLLAIVGMLYPFQVTNINALKAVGRTDVMLWLTVIKRITAVAFIFATYRYGVTGLIYGQIAQAILSYVINSIAVGIFIEYGTVRQIRDLLPAFAAASLMTALVAVSGEWLTWPYLPPFVAQSVRLIAQIAMGMILYSLLCSWFRIPAYGELVNLLGSRLNRLLAKAGWVHKQT